MNEKLERLCVDLRKARDTAREERNQALRDWREAERRVQFYLARNSDLIERLTATEGKLAAWTDLLDEIEPAWREAYSDPLNYVRSLRMAMVQRHDDWLDAVNHGVEMERKLAAAKRALEAAIDALHHIDVDSESPWGLWKWKAIDTLAALDADQAGKGTG